MARNVRIGLIQASLDRSASESPADLKKSMIAKHVDLLARAAHMGAQIICLQELFNGPYFCAEQDPRWFELAERIPEGLTTQILCEQARQHRTVIIGPIAETDGMGSYYNSAAVIDVDGACLGVYRKTHLPQMAPGFWEKYYFRPGNLGYPVFETCFGRIGVYLCYDRHFPEGLRALALRGAEIVFNPSAGVAGPGEALWKLELPAQAVMNQCFAAGVNRVGREDPWQIGEFFGTSYVCSPRGRILAEARRAEEDVLVTEVNLEEVYDFRHALPLLRDRRPETYGPVTTP